MSQTSATALARKAAAGVGGIGSLVALFGLFYSDIREIKHDVAEQGQRIARMEGRQGKIVEYQEWLHGDSEKLEELKQ